MLTPGIRRVHNNIQSLLSHLSGGWIHSFQERMAAITTFAGAVRLPPNGISEWKCDDREDDEMEDEVDESNDGAMLDDDDECDHDDDDDDDDDVKEDELDEDNAGDDGVNKDSSIRISFESISF